MDLKPAELFVVVLAARKKADPDSPKLDIGRSGAVNSLAYASDEMEKSRLRK